MPREIMRRGRGGGGAEVGIWGGDEGGGAKEIGWGREGGKEVGRRRKERMIGIGRERG